MTVLTARLKWALALEKALGLIFIASAWTKALDLSAFNQGIAAYRIIEHADLIRWIAVLLLGLETLLGVALLLGGAGRKWVYPVTFAALLFFSAALLYAWLFKGLQDCGCLGARIKMSPGVSLLKNTALLALALFTCIQFAKHQLLKNPAALIFLERYPAAWIVSASCVALILFPLGLRPSASPKPDIIPQNAAEASGNSAFAHLRFDAGEIQYDLGKGAYFLALLSVACEDCKASVAKLNALKKNLPDLPPVLALCLGEEDTLQTFRAETRPDFPTLLLEPAAFFELIGDAPPRFVLLNEGAIVLYWDEEAPEMDELALFLN